VKNKSEIRGIREEVTSDELRVRSEEEKEVKGQRSEEKKDKS